MGDSVDRAVSGTDGKGLEFQGRLARADRRPASPGRYDLLFRLHPAAASDDVLWSEVQRRVEVVPGGFFRVVLGAATPLEPALFDRGPLWLSTRVVRGGEPAPEHAPRVPLLGTVLRLSARVDAAVAGLDALERAIAERVRRRDDELNLRIARLRDAVESLRERVAGLETDERFARLGARLDAALERLERVDGEGGRLDRIEDELDDLVGPDGDVVDLNERMDQLEGRAPELIDALRKRMGQGGGATIEDLGAQVERLRRRVAELESRPVPEPPAPPPLPRPEDIGAVRRAGDVMTGGLTINRGGLNVLSGGVSCRGASVTTLDASHVVRTPKLIADSVELRGDLTVDSTHRALQARLVEGRRGSSRKDGALFLNARGGARVTVGNAESARGLGVHGPVDAGRATVRGTALAVLLPFSSGVEAGEVVRMSDDGRRLVRTTRAGDPRALGVAVADAGLVLGGPPGGGRLLLALAGVVDCRVEAGEAPIRVGDLLVPSAVPGRARAAGEEAAPAGVLGRALAPLAEGEGVVPVLLSGR